MITCTIIAAIVHCLNMPAQKPAPADAARVLTTSVQQFIVAPKREAWRDIAVYGAERARVSSGMPAPTPTKPLSEPWSVTTRDIPGIGTFTWFNGKLVH